MVALIKEQDCRAGTVKAGSKFLFMLVLCMLILLLAPYFTLLGFYQSTVVQKQTELAAIKQRLSSAIDRVAGDLKFKEDSSGGQPLPAVSVVSPDERKQALIERLKPLIKAFQRAGFTLRWHEIGEEIPALQNAEPAEVVMQDSKLHTDRLVMNSGLHRLSLLDYIGLILGRPIKKSPDKLIELPVPNSSLVLQVGTEPDHDQSPYTQLIRPVFYLTLILMTFFIAVYARQVYQSARGVNRLNRQFQGLVENLVEWVWDMDRNGHILQCSHQVKDILGYTPDELSGIPLYKLLKVQERGKLQETLQYSQRYHLDINGLECIFKDRSGRELIVEMKILALTDSRGGVSKYRVIGQDVTERKSNQHEIRRYQENLEKMVDDRTIELEKANEELRNFAYIVSHDLRSPLVSITGFASELDDDFTHIQDKLVAASEHKQEMEIGNVLTESIPESIHYIKTAAQKMNRLVNSILELARIGRRDLVFEVVDVGEVIDDVLHSLAYQIEEKGVIVNIGAMPELQTDKLAMELIFNNLLGNALKYLQPGKQGNINVSAVNDGRETLFNVDDNGCGIAAEDLPVIFDLFKRGGGHQVSGEGMGLTYVRTIIRRLGGQIRCRSRVGVGTRFEFSLPNTQVCG